MAKIKSCSLAKGIKFLLVLLVLLMSLNPVTTYAEGGDGSGNTSGVFKPLGLVSVTLEDGTDVMGAENIPLEPKFTFHFDKNVVYLLYWKQNVACFHLTDESGQEVSTYITKIDDTVDFSKRQYIWVEPVEPLEPGTVYTFYISPDLLAKNGGSTLAMTTDNKGETFSFTTEGEKLIKTESESQVEENSSEQSAVIDNGNSDSESNDSSESITEPTQVQSDEIDESKPTENQSDEIITTEQTQNQIIESTSVESSEEAQDTTSNQDSSGITTETDNTIKDATKSGDEVVAVSQIQNTQAESDEAFQALVQKMKIQKMVGWGAFVILLLWIGFEIIRRRKKASGRNQE